MAIDPKLYEKYSGRKGDPYARLGEALIQADKQKERTRDREGSVNIRWRFFRVLTRLFRGF